MRKTFMIAATLIVTGLSTEVRAQTWSLFEKQYKLIGETVGAKSICNKNACDPRGLSVGRFLPLVQPITPNVDDTSSSETIARSLLGRVSPNLAGGISILCSQGNAHPFAPSDMGPLGTVSESGVLSFKLNRTTQASIDVKAAAQADLAALKALGLPDLELAAMAAKLETAYKTLNEQTLGFQGNYFAYELKQDAIIDVLRGSGRFKECHDFLLENANRQLITAVGIITYNVVFTKGLISDAFAGVYAELEAKKITYALEASVRQKVNMNLQINGEKLFQVIGLGHVTPTKDRL